MAALRAFIDEADISPKAPLVGDGILLLYCGNREAYLKSSNQPVICNRTCSWAYRILAIVLHGYTMSSRNNREIV